ncbi:MAG: transposase family protein [Dehalococcoidia bacterium]
MLAPDTVYPLLLAWVQALGAVPHRAAARALAQRLSALLLGQSLAPASLLRTLPSPTTVPARQRYARVARTWTCPWLTSAWLTPVLVRAALALVRPDGTPLLVLDSVRCGGWEVFTLGLRWHRRVLLVGWSVLPYPWPKRRYTPAVCALLRQVAAAWPKDTPAPHLVGDRGFPSRAFFQTLVECGWGWTVRLSARSSVTVAGQATNVRALWGTDVPEHWTRQAAHYGGGGRGPQAQLLIGQGLVVYPWHQRDAGSARARQYRAGRRLHHVHGKHPRRRTPGTSAETDRWIALFSTDPSVLSAVRQYRLRPAIEGSYRDAQSGWDGRHGWDLEPTLTRQRDAGVVERIVGLWALGLLVQSWVGDQAGQADAPAAVQQVVRGWTVHGRLSVFARGRFAFQDQSGALASWLADTLAAGATRVAVRPADAADLSQAA